MAAVTVTSPPLGVIQHCSPRVFFSCFTVRHTHTGWEKERKWKKSEAVMNTEAAAAAAAVSQLANKTRLNERRGRTLHRMDTRRRREPT